MLDATRPVARPRRRKIVREPSKVVQIVHARQRRRRRAAVNAASRDGLQDPRSSSNRSASIVRARLRVVLGSRRWASQGCSDRVALAACAVRGPLPNYPPHSPQSTGRQGARAMEPLKLVALDDDDLDGHLHPSAGCRGQGRPTSSGVPQEKRLVRGARPLRLARGGRRQAASSAAAARRCGSSGSRPASAAASIRPARTRCSTCWRSTFAEPTRPPAWSTLVFSGGGGAAARGRVPGGRAGRPRPGLGRPSAQPGPRCSTPPTTRS